MSDFFSPGQARLIANFLLGGAVAGATGAGLVSVAQDVKDKIRDANPDTGADDDIVYVDVPGKPAPAKKHAVNTTPAPALKSASFAGGLLTPGIALAGGTVTGIEAYRALRKVFLKRKQAQLQKEVDEAQHIALGPVTPPADDMLEKAASNGPMSVGDAVMLGVPVGIPLLLAYAAHKVSHEALKKTFPQLQPPSEKPTRIVVRTRQGPTPEGLGLTPKEEEKETIEPQVKAAALNEFLIDMACACDPDNTLGLSGLVKAAACGRYGDICDSVRETQALDDACDVIGTKYAAVKVSPANYRAGLRLLSESSLLAPGITLLAAAHITDSTPTFGAMHKAASEDIPAWDGWMDKVATAYVFDARQSAFGRLHEIADHVKSADDMGMPNAGSVLAMIAQRLGKSDDNTSDPVTAAEGRDSTEAGSAMSGPEVLAGDSKAGNLIHNKKDFVDVLLEAARQPASPQGA